MTPHGATTFDRIVLGAGPAGLVCAATAAERGERVCRLDKASRPATKLLLAGGGKANITNQTVSLEHYLGENPAFTARALHGWTSANMLDYLREAGIPLEERDHGRMFCKKSARDVLDHLLVRCEAASCRLYTGWNPASVRSLPDGGFLLENGGQRLSAANLVLATGSPAWPQCGADDSGLHLARAFGHRIVPPRPVLVPLRLPEKSPFNGLAGISLDVSVRCDAPDSPTFTDALLFTHKGCSGPAILQISGYWRKGMSLTVDFLPHADYGAMLDAPSSGKSTPHALLVRHMPERLAAALLPDESARRKAAELSRKDRERLRLAVHNQTLIPTRSEGLQKAEACAGGVDTREVNPDTMQSLKMPGLFFCGEILDIAGRLGGYNLHWAWASGKSAGLGG